jgi:hypothetical protein
MAKRLLGSLLLLATPLVAIDFGFNYTGLESPGLLDELSQEMSFVQCLIESYGDACSSSSFATHLVLLSLEQALIFASSSCR